MKKTHTPGPWRVDEVGDITSEGGDIACSLSYPDAKANAKLIAAAPEMLDILIDIHKSLLSDGKFQSAAAIQKVINKATGAA